MATLPLHLGGTTQTVGSSGLPGSAHPMGLLDMHSPEQGVGRLQAAP